VNHSTIAPKPAISLAQANKSHLGKKDPLAQARPFSPRRGLKQENSGLCDVSLRRAPSRLSEIALRSKWNQVAWATVRAEKLGRASVSLA